MGRAVTCVMVVALALCALLDEAMSRAPEPRRSAARDVPEYVVALYYTQERGMAAYASGIVVDGSGLLLTNDHVAAAGGTALAWVAGEACLADPIPDARWPEDDLALLRISCTSGGPRIVLPSLSAGTQFAAPVNLVSRRICGPTEPEPCLVREESIPALVIAPYETEPPRQTGLAKGKTAVCLLRESAEHEHLGKSGSPVTDASGQVVGIVSAAYRSFVFIVPIGKAKTRIALWQMRHAGTAD